LEEHRKQATASGKPKTENSNSGGQNGDTSGKVGGGDFMQTQTGAEN